MAKKILLGMLLCAAAGLLAACDNGVSSQPTATFTVPPLSASPTAPAIPTIPLVSTTLPVATALTTPTKSTASGRPTAPVVGWNYKLTYEQTGGVAGVKQTLLVGPAGQARLVEGTKNSGPVRLTAERLAKIKTKLDTADVFNLKDHYGNGNVADDFLLTITLTQGAVTKKVVVEQEGGKGVTPQQLLDFISDLEVLKGEINAMPQMTATPTASVAATATVSPGTPPASGTWNNTLIYERTGGFASVKRTLKIGPNGQARLTEDNADSGPIRFTQEKLSEIQGKLDTAHFFDLKESYGQLAADGYVVTITLTQGGRTKSVTVSQGNDEDVPAELNDLLIAMNSLAGEVVSMGTPVATP